MTENVSNIAIITARGGSKRIPRKNIRCFRGRPMLAWSIEAALDAGVFSTVMVSTDDAEIAEIALSLGAEVPFMRRDETADDFSTTADVLSEVLQDYLSRGELFENTCCIYPTAPFVCSSDLKLGYNKLITSEFDVIMPIAPFSYPIWRSLSCERSGRIVLNFPENRNKRSQDLPTAFHDAGQWYWLRNKPFFDRGCIMGEKTGSVILSEMQVQDIDTEEDWELAEIKHKRMFESNEAIT